MIGPYGEPNEAQATPPTALTPEEQAYCKAAEHDSPDAPVPAAPLLDIICRLDRRIEEFENPTGAVMSGGVVDWRQAYQLSRAELDETSRERDALQARVRDMEHSWRVAEEQRLDLVLLAKQQEAREARLRIALRKHACFCGPQDENDPALHREDCPYHVTLAEAKG